MNMKRILFVASLVFFVSSVAGTGPAKRGTSLFGGGNAAASNASGVIDPLGSRQINGGTQQFKLSSFLEPVPVAARTVEDLLQMTRVTGTKDGYADNLPFSLTAPQTCTPLPSGAVGWWKAEGNANDVLGTNNGVLHNGTSFSTGLIGQAFSFDGVDDYVSINRSIQDDFTIEFWLNTTQVVGSDGGQWYAGQGLVDGEVLSVTNDFGVTLLNGKVLFGVGNPDTTIRSGFVADGNWHHIAATRLRSLGDMKLYVDGAQVAASTAGTQSLTAPPQLTFGIQVDGHPFQGRLDEVAIYNRPLSPTEIQAIFNAGSAGKSGTYSISPQNQNFGINGGTGSFGITVILPASCPWVATSNDNWITTTSTGTGSGSVDFTVAPNPGFGRSGTISAGGQTFTVSQDGELLCFPAPAGLISWFKAEGNADDTQGLGSGTLLNGTTFAAGKVGQAFSLDGINDYVRIPDSAALRPTNVTLEAWINFSSNPTGTRMIFNKPLGNGNLDSYQIFYENGQLQGLVSDLSGLGPRLQFTLAPVLGTWYHVAYTFDDPSDRQVLYLNGVAVTAGTVTKSIAYDNHPLLIGADTENGVEGSFPFPGLIDEASIFGRALSQTEIQSIFNAGSNGKCAPGSIQSLSFTPNPVNGGQSSTGTVRLTTAAPAGGTVVNLSSNISIATVPPSLTISEGQTTGTVSVTTLVPMSDTTALITASNQTGVTSANLTVLAPKPDLTISAATVPASTQTDAAFNISWTVRNQGQARAVAPWTDRVFLSTDNQLGNDILIGEFPFNSDLDPNQTADRIQTLTIARNAISQDGPYFLLIQTDANNQINEGINEDNNVVARPINITRPPRPDLVVDSIVAPSTAFFGQTILVQWTVKNNGGGPTNAQAWQDFVYLSLDNVPEIEDPFKIPVPNVSYLAAGESYTATADVRIPQGLVGQYKIIVWTDGDGTNHRSNSFPHQVIEDDEENNYGIARPIQINTPPLPDLQTVSVVAPEDVFAGGQMTLSWRVENHGDGVTPPDQTNWLDKIYLSQDATLDVNTDRLVGSRSRSGALAPNEGYTVTNFNATLPNDIAGDWFVFVLTDADNQVYEFNNETNNANYDNQQPGSPMHIHATPPDLVILSPINAPATGSNGQSLSFSWTVKNQGAFDAAPNWFDAVYLSADQTLNTASDALLTSVFRSSSLGPGLTYDVTANVTVPPCISGTYYLFVLTDSRGQIFEFDPNINAEANNSSQPRSIQIADATPDLRVTGLSNPATGIAGQPISVSWTVANQSTGATGTAKWTDRIYFTPTQTFDSSTALLIASFDHTGALNAGANYTRTENLTIPNTAQGNYFVIVLTDANNEVEECTNNANNTGVGSQSIAISNSLPDFVVQTASSQSSSVGGQTVSVNWTVANQGTAAANNASWGDAVYFSSDTVLDNNDLRLATAPASGPLAIGATYNRQVQVTLPVVSPGNYFLIIQTDYLGNVFEGQHEDNNLRTVAVTIQVPAVDLMVTTVDAPSTAFSGQEMTVSWTVLNNGSNPTIGSHWIDEVVLSLDQIDDPTDPVIASKQHNGVLNSHTSYNDSLSVFVPQGFTGQYYVFVRTDRRNEVAESNENNNSASDGIVFNLTPPADLVVSNIAPPSSGSPGESITVNWTIQNSGTNPATGSWDDAVYLSSDQTWDIGDILIGKRTQAGPLATGQSYNGQLTATLPAINPGGYYIIVKTDVQNRVRETNDNNNTGAASTQTTIDVTALQIGVPINTTLLTGQERFYKTNAPANETVRFALDGQTGSANELFARFGLIASRNSFDFLFSRPNEANQEIVVPNSQAGNYFTLARSVFSMSSPQSVMIKAEVIPFGITSVSPDHIGDNGQVTITLKGARFEVGATVQLVHGGMTLNAATVIRVDSSTVKARFIFTNAPRGIYDVILTNPGGQMTTQSGAVTVEQATLSQPVIISIGSLRTRPLRSLIFSNEVTNRGNVDIQYVAIRTQVFRPDSTNPIVIINQRPTNSFPRKSDFPAIDWNNAPLTNSYLHNLTSDAFLYRDLPPGGVLSYQTEVRGLNVDRSFVRNQVVGLSRSEMAGAMRETAEFIRGELIDRGISSPRTETKDGFWDFFNGVLTLNGILEGVVEDAPSTYRSAIVSGLRQARNALAFDAAGDVCNLLVDNGVTDCGLKCTAKFGCCNIGTAGYALGAFESFAIGNPIFGALNSFMVGWNEAKCVSDIPDCFNSCPKPMPTACMLGGSANSEEFTQACVNAPKDPNEKLSPDGYGEPRFVPIQQEIPYTINFENVSTATAYAQRIRITDQLDPNLDPRTLRLREIGFKQYRIQVPDNRAFFQQRVQLGADLGNLLADISAGVDLSTGMVTWTLTAIDPATGEQPNGTNLGLLPPNNASNDGQGFVSFTIKPKSTTTTGVVIHNGAIITFDTEAPINTNTVSNAIDADAPTSAVDSLPATQSSPTFNISWSGSDAPNSSGLLNYDIYYSANDGPYQLSVSGTTATSTQFTGEPNTTYRFYSIARDNAGNIETAPASPDATTTVGTPAPNPPQATAATSVTSSSFTANWSSSSGATGYRLDVSTDNSFTSYVSGYQGVDVGNVFTRAVTGLTASTTYYYRVRAYNAGATGGNSNTISVITSCIPSLSSSSQSFPREGGAGTVDVTASVGCGWSVASNDSWITISSGSTGSGNGPVDYSVAANMGPARVGTMTIAGQTFTVPQSSGCVFMLSSTSQNFIAAGGMNSVNVTAATGCAWTAVSNDAFITVNSGTPGSGNGTVNYSVATNTGPARMGTMTIAVQTFTVTQNSGCMFTLNRDHQSFPGNGGMGTVNITTSDAACTWTASTTSTFITINSGASGMGNGSVQYTVAINAGSTIRSDAITIAGQTYTVYEGINFLDVPSNDLFYTDIGKLAARGVTVGCGGGNYCPNSPVTREQMAAFIMRATEEFNPPTPQSQRFTDVPPQNVFYNFIDRMAVLGITVGCTPDHLQYCPSDPVRREQMAAFLLRGLGEFNPPTPASQRFTDVPSQNVFYNFIDRMAVLNITLGCTPDHLMYCPSDSVTRAQMAAFLVRAFNL
jgi:subtilase family serine protease